jgi:hypothetical protein
MVILSVGDDGLQIRWRRREKANGGARTASVRARACAGRVRMRLRRPLWNFDQALF